MNNTSPRSAAPTAIVVENQSGPIPGLEYVSQRNTKLLKCGSTGVSVDVLPSPKNESVKGPDNFTRITSEKLFGPLKHPVDGAKQVKPNVTVSNGKFQLVLNAPTVVKMNSLPENTKERKEMSSRPYGVLLNNNPSLRKPTMNTKVVMSTVSKRVPLVSTIGNCSKAPAFAAAVLSSSAANHVSPSLPVSSVAAHDEVKTFKSILEASLTSSNGNGSSHQNNQGRIKSTFVPQIFTINNPIVNKNLVVNQTKVSCGGTDMINDNLNVVSVGNISLSEKSTTLKKPQPLAVLSYEKGLTRLVPIKPRAVVLVDVGVQVILPDNDEGSGVIENSNNIGATLQPAGKHSINQGKSNPSVPTSPLKPGQLVTVNPKTGKMVIAIPKHLLNSSSGAKTLLLNGKPVKVQVKTSDSPDSSTHQTYSKAESPLNGSKDLSSGEAKEANFVGVLSKPCPSVPYDTSPCTSIATLLDSTAPSSKLLSPSLELLLQKTPCHNSSSTSCSVTSNISDSVRTPSSCSSIVSSTLRLCPTSNGSTTYSNHNLSSINNLSFTSLSTETITTPSFQSPLSLLSPVPSDNNDSLILPLNSPVHSLNNSGTVHTIPNSSLLVLVPNTLKQASDSSDKAPLELAMSSAESGSDSAVQDSRKPCHSQKDTEPLKVKPLDLERKAVSNNESAYKNLNTMDSVMSSKLKSCNSNVPVQINDVLRSAFNDFKNCLSPNKDGDMPIHIAVEDGNEVAVKRQCLYLAARKASVNLLNADDETPLQIALLLGHSSIARLLISYGADATVTDKEENSTLHLAVLFADHLALEALLQSGQFSKTGIDVYNEEGFTPLHLAAQHNKLKEINLLVKYECQIDKLDARSGRTALYHAIERGNYKAQQLLVRLGADIREPTFFGHTPLFASKSDVISQLASGQHTTGDIVEAVDVGRPRKRQKTK